MDLTLCWCKHDADGRISNALLLGGNPSSSGAPIMGPFFLNNVPCKKTGVIVSGC